LNINNEVKKRKRETFSIRLKGGEGRDGGRSLEKIAGTLDVAAGEAGYQAVISGVWRAAGLCEVPV
jgi:hypothetical protein